MNGSKLELFNEARLLGVTLDSKLTWKPHITRITRKATTTLLQCRQIVGKSWGIKPSMMKWIYTTMICPIMWYALEMATAPRTRRRAVVGAPRRAAWQLKSVFHHSVGAAPRTISFYIFFTIIVGKLFHNVQQWLVMMQL